MTVGSEQAWLERVESRRRRNEGFVVNVEGVGMGVGDVPIEREGVGGVVGRRESV